MTKYKLGEICDLNKESLSSKDSYLDIEYLDTSSITENTIDNIQYIQYCDAPSRAKRKVRHNTIVYSTVRPRLKHYGILTNPAENLIVSTGFVTIDVKEEFADTIDPYYLFLYLTKPLITDNLANIADTAVSAYPSINPSDLANIIIDCPKLNEQRKIASLIQNVDNKIALNRALNHNLEAMAKQLYDYWFVQFDFPDKEGKPYKSSGGKMVWNVKLKRYIPEGWECKNLLDIAIFTNGLACQKYRPTTEAKLPVIKIREMHDGFTTDTEWVKADIPDSVKIFNGDVLFSWSASLEVMLWCFGEGGLNQHIFKVTGKDGFPRSYYYYQLKDYVNVFKAIAEARKTTMGHITQDHLQQSTIAVPPTTELPILLEKKIAPLFEQIITLQEENAHLVKLRDELLPLLMNGQVSVNYDLSAD